MTPREPEDTQRKYRESNRRRMTAPQQHYTISRAKLIELLKDLPCQFEPTVMKALTQTTVAAPTPTPQQPHPLRCGTCSKYEGDSKERYGCCKDNGEQITKLTYLFTEFHGCASHSAASQQPPAPAVLLDALMILDAMIDQEELFIASTLPSEERLRSSSMERKTALTNARVEIAALRQRGEQHE